MEDHLLDDILPPSEPEYPPFLLRAIAFFFDLLIVGIPINIFLSRFDGWPWDVGAGPSLLSTVAIWLYFAIQESSWRQATIGKHVMGLKVTDMNGERLTFLRATGRHFGKMLSSAILAVGYFMAGFTEKKQALHDILAGTLVVRA